MIARELGERVARFRHDDLSPSALDMARRGLLDTVGVTLAGADQPATDVVAAALAVSGTSSGPATIFGRDRGAPLLDAALVNGTASHALDFDDCSNTLGGHPSAPILAGLWALAESRGARGVELATAYAVGIEVESKIGRAVNFHHYEIGWHPTATLGTFGAAAACAHLLGLDAGRTAAALALAASMAGGLKANFGTMAKPFHVGQCSRNGLLAALMAAEGMTAAADVFEHPQGFFAVFDGMDNVAPARVLDEWMSPCELDEPGLAFKRHPCCASTHPAIDAMLALRQDHGLRPETVAHVRSWTHPRRLRHTNRPDPKTGLDGKFSVQYVLARALQNGLVGIGDFDDAAVRDPVVRAIMAKIEAAPHPEARMDTTEHFYAELRVTTVSGDVLDQRIDRPLGRDREHPLPPGALEAKFLDCASRALTRDSAEATLAALQRIEDVPDVSSISRSFVLRPTEGLRAAAVG